MCEYVYRGLSIVDHLSHEISIKHSFSYNGKPCDKMTYAQSPQLFRHLLRIETEMRNQDEVYVGQDFDKNGRSSLKCFECVVLQHKNRSKNTSIFPFDLTLNMDNQSRRTVVPLSAPTSLAEPSDDRLLTDRCNSRLSAQRWRSLRSFRLREVVIR